MTYTPTILAMRANIKAGMLSFVDGVNMLMGYGMSLCLAMKLLEGSK